MVPERQLETRDARSAAPSTVTPSSTDAMLAACALNPVWLGSPPKRFQSLAACASAESVWHLDMNRRDEAACPSYGSLQAKGLGERDRRMRQLRTDIEIDATAERVWAILTDFASYPAWNPFIQSIRGEPPAGSKLEVRIAPPDGKAMTFKSTVLNAEPNRELRWLGRVFLPRIFDGEHMLQIEPSPTDACGSCRQSGSEVCSSRSLERRSTRRSAASPP
jgi:hypothetical protein